MSKYSGYSQSGSVNEKLMTMPLIFDAKDMNYDVDELIYDSGFDSISYEEEYYYDHIMDDFIAEERIYNLLDVENEFEEDQYYLNGHNVCNHFQNFYWNFSSSNSIFGNIIGIFPLRYQSNIECIFNSMFVNMKRLINISKRLIWNVATSTLLLGVPLYITVIIERHELQRERYFEMLPYTNLIDI